MESQLDLLVILVWFGSASTAAFYVFTRFQFFFFASTAPFDKVSSEQYTRALFTDSTNYVTFSLKMSPTTLFTHLKFILLQCFQFSISAK